MAIVNGDIKKIDLGESSFEMLREHGSLYIDKSLFIEHFFNEQSKIQLIARQRRLGKTLNLKMLASFLSHKKNCASLFRGLAIEGSPCFSKLNSAPVFYFDFKNLTVEDYKEKIAGSVHQYLSEYVDPEQLKGNLKRLTDQLLTEPNKTTHALHLLTEIIYDVTGKKSYILIDEYDKLLVDNYNSEHYEAIQSYETALLSTGLKNNDYLEKALMTGVMRVSRESMLSGLNNLQTYDLFDDDCYTNDFGLTELEIDTLQRSFEFDKATLKAWYNGIKINGTAIYNIYSVLSYCQKQRYLNYWGQSGRIEMIINALTPKRYERLTQLLTGETVSIPIEQRISPKALQGRVLPDKAFYSLLAQTGYLSVEKTEHEITRADVKIPNIELINVWKTFILDFFIKDEDQLIDLFSQTHDLPTLDKTLANFLSDRLSFHDITKSNERTKEEIYHVFVLGLLSAFHGINGQTVYSNREAGSGRYDLLLELGKCSLIFEFKSVEKEGDLLGALDEAIGQIDEKRYFAEAPLHKPLIKVGVAFFGKQCVVKSVLHVC